MKTLFGISILVVSITISGSCKKDKASVPAVSTTQISQISYTTAASGGTVQSDGGSLLTSRGVCWNTSSNPTIVDSKTIDSIGSRSFKSILTQLTPNTIYYVRAYATNSVGTGYGNVETFTTKQLKIPELETTTVTGITKNIAFSGGNVTNDNGSLIICKGVCWSTNTSPTIILSTKTSDGSGTGTFVSSITGLLPATIYYVRSYATNGIGTGYGNEVSFVTSPDVPKLNTSSVSSVTVTSAISGGSISSDGGSAVISRGVCWSLNPDPTTDLSTKTSDGTGSGTFISSMTGLTTSAIYYVRSYAMNSAGTAYGNQTIFITDPDRICDIDKNIYKIITIGSQVWMEENLKTTRFSDGTLISNITGPTEWSQLSTPAYCWYNNDPAIYKEVYGGLYNWNSVQNGNLCPDGWHVPSNADWLTLTDYLGGSATAGDKIKETGTVHWLSPNTGATNESGFTALPAGGRTSSGTYFNIGRNSYWWTSTEDDATDAWFSWIGQGISTVTSNNTDKNYGYSVRCIKN